MIALMFLAGAIVWLVVAVALALWIPSRLGMERFGWVVSLLLFPAILVAPIADEWIGSRQFKALCEREAVVTLSPDWENVKRAKAIDDPDIYLNEYAMPIKKRVVNYIDMDSGKVFAKYNYFYTYGGFLMGRMGLGLGSSSSCSPKNRGEVLNMLKQRMIFE